jgi:hypothetical protein
MNPVKYDWVVYKRKVITVYPILQPNRSQRPSGEVTSRDHVRHSFPLEATCDGCQVQSQLSL